MADETKSELTPEQMAARIAELEARLTKSGTLRFKVSEKGAVSVYGLGRFRSLCTSSNGKGSCHVPTNCASSSKPTEHNSRQRIKSRILNPVRRNLRPPSGQTKRGRCRARRGRAFSIWPWCSMRSAARSWAGRWRPTCAPNWCSRRSTWRSHNAAPPA